MKIQHLNQKLILGSSSSYRYELLLRLQLPFEVSSPDIDESVLTGEMPEATASRLAEEKARVVASIYPNALIIGSDQVATLGGVTLGKPLNYENATKQLTSMRGKEVIFHTALSLFNSCSGRMQSKLVSSLVKFRELSDQQISNYLAKEQPYHCAGSAKYEGLGIALIERMESDDTSAIIGLPLITLVDMLVHEGVEVI